MESFCLLFQFFELSELFELALLVTDLTDLPGNDQSPLRVTLACHSLAASGSPKIFHGLFVAALLITRDSGPGPPQHSSSIAT